MRHATLMLLALSALSRGLAAQATLPIAPGERVRLTLDGGRPAVAGLLLSHDADSVRVQLQAGAQPTVIARTAISEAAVSRGRHGHAGTGALVGLLAGGVVGGAAGAGCSGDWLCPGAGGGALLLGGTGLLFGAILGVFVRSERWEQVYENPVQVGFTPPGRGLGVRVSIRL